MLIFLLGIFFELISTASGTVGKQLIRYSEQKKEEGAAYRAKVAITIGLVLNTACGPILDILAYAFAPAVLIAPIGALDIVWNILSAPYTLGEPLTKQRGIAVGIIFSSTFLSTFVGSHDEVTYTIELVKGYLFRWRSFTYFVFWLIWINLNIFYLMRFPKGSIIRGLSLGMTAGSIAGNMFCVKMAVELVKTAISEGSGEVFTDFVFYLVLICAVGFAVSNVAFMTKGLKEYEAIFMVTVYEGSMVTVNSLSALVVLSEMDGRPAWRILAYIACLLGLIAGQAYLVHGEKIHKAESSEEELVAVADPDDAENCASACVLCTEESESEEDEDSEIAYHAQPLTAIPVAASPASIQSVNPAPFSTPIVYQRFP